MTCKKYIEDYIGKGMQEVSEQETQMVRAAIMQLSKLLNDELYQKAAKVWGAEEEALIMPDNMEEEAVIGVEDIYIRIPSYMAYETYVGKKEKYNAILMAVKGIRNALYDTGIGLCYDFYEKQTAKKILETGEFKAVSTGFYLMGLIDTLSVMSEEIFEHYKQFEAFFKEGVKGILSYYSKENPVFLVYPRKEASEDNPKDIGASLMIAYVLFKGCIKHALLKEKYQPIANAVFEACIRELEETDTYEDVTGELFLAYAGYLALLQCEGEDITALEL